MNSTGTELLENNYMKLNGFTSIFNVTPYMLPHLLYNPTHALFTKTRLYLLKVILHFHNSCKLIDYNLASDFNIGPKIRHTLLHIKRHRPDSFSWHIADGWRRFAFLTRWNSVHLQVLLSATPQRGNVSRGITTSSTTRVFGEYFLKISVHKNS